MGANQLLFLWCVYMIFFSYTDFRICRIHKLLPSRSPSSPTKGNNNGHANAISIYSNNSITFCSFFSCMLLTARLSSILPSLHPRSTFLSLSVFHSYMLGILRIYRGMIHSPYSRIGYRVVSFFCSSLSPLSASMIVGAPFIATMLTA